jgi:DNA-binding Lrp family transcriptional regulator
VFVILTFNLPHFDCIGVGAASGFSTAVIDGEAKPKGGDSMAVKAFVLIEVAMGKTKEVTTMLENMDGVKSVDAVTGPYDVIAIVEMPDVNTLGELVTKHIHSVSGIARTVTCLTMQLVQG